LVSVLKRLTPAMISAVTLAVFAAMLLLGLAFYKHPEPAPAITARTGPAWRGVLLAAHCSRASAKSFFKRSRLTGTPIRGMPIQSE